MGSFWKITSSRMKFCVMLCNLLIRLINCSPPEVTVSRLLVQFNVILCMYSMCMNDLLFMIISNLSWPLNDLALFVNNSADRSQIFFLMNCNISRC